jgi:hypothetical protein
MSTEFFYPTSDKMYPAVADSKSKQFPLIFKGIDLKREYGLLPDGVFSSTVNVTSIQEGGIGPRRGTVESSINLSVGVIHSISKLSISTTDATNPRYVGSGPYLYRVTGPYSTFLLVATSTINARWEAATFNAGTAGTPYIFFARQGNMVWDNGSFGPPLYPWGISPALMPAFATPANPNLTNNNGFVTLTTQSGGTNRLSGISVSSATSIGLNYWTVTPNSMLGIASGMYVFIGGVLCVVDATAATSFNTYATSAPSGAINSYYEPVNLTSSGGSAPTLTANGDSYYGEWDASVDWSFNGDPDDGYSSDDLVHIGIQVSDTDNIVQLRIEVLVNGSTQDYYLKALTPSVVQGLVDGTETATEVQTTIATETTTGVLGSTEYPSGYGSTTKPVQIGAQTDPPFFEFDIPKSSFLPVNNAGQGAYSWKNVTGVRVWADSETISGSPTFTVYVGAIYAHGNQGPDSISSPDANPYSYCFTLCNPNTQEEGQPSQYMVPSNFINVQLRAVQVTVYGFNTASSGNPALTGMGSIKVYRAGGTFADQLYRFVGYAQNPGVNSGGFPLSTTFIDNYSDADIENNDEMLIDNYPPVASSLPNPYNSTLASNPSTAAGSPYPNLVQIAISPSPASQFFTVGSPVTIGSGANQEIATVIAVDPGGVSSILVYLQNTHFAGESITADFVVGQYCDIVCQAGDALLLAGDPNNPHICYRSKAGYPSQWPIINFETGNSHQQIIGSPDNPIMGLLEFNGAYVSLNLRNIYTFYIWLGAFENITVSPSDRGMIGKHLWCRVNDEIWFVAYDGIYAWNGGTAVKMTEALDPIFVGLSANGFAPINLTLTQNIYIECFENYVYLSYQDTNGFTNQLRYSLIYKRWEPLLYSQGAGGIIAALTAMYTERDTGRLIAGVYINFTGASVLCQLEQGLSDFATSPTATGVGINWSAMTGFMAPESRTMNKQFLELMVELLNPNDTVNVKLFYDYSGTADSIDQFTIAPSSGRQFLPLPLGVSGGSTFGKEARVVAVEFSGESTGAWAVYSVELTYIPLAELQRGRITDWQDNGHPWDKRIYSITLDFNTYGNTVTLELDTISGVNGDTQTNGVQAIVLQGVGRSQKEFPINDGVIAKKIRLRASVPNSNFEIFGWKATCEDYPQDIVFFTEYTDGGNPFEKYYQQLILDVNTNGYAVSVGVDLDGVIVQTVTVTSTLDTRNQQIVLGPDLMGKKARLLLTSVPSGGMFQLWSANYDTQPADKGPVKHSFDWDDLGTPFDKRLITISFEYDTGGSEVEMLMDVITGVQGDIITTAIQSFTFLGTGRSRPSFPINIDTIVKMIRIYPASTFVTEKVWKYSFTKIDYPPDIIAATEWSDNGWKCEKVWRGVEIDIDTGGIACELQLELDGTIVQSWTITTTDIDRVRILTCNSNLIGKLARLIPTPGTGGKAQIFKVTYDVWNEPCYRTIWDSYEVTLGYVGFKVIRQMWVEYLCTAGIVVSVYVGNDELFFQQTLPAHTWRDVERFFLPDQANGQYNKSKVYRIVITSENGTTPFKLYMDSTRIESLALSGQQRSSYAQFDLGMLTQPRV